MSSPYLSLYVHLIWSVKHRQPLLTTDIEPSVYRCINAECERCRALLLAVGGIETHVHLLIAFPPTLALSQLVKQIKGSSSHFVTHELQRPDFFWQGGYGAFTLHRSHVPRVQDYINRQKEHHANNTLIAILEQDEEEFPLQNE